MNLTEILNLSNSAKAVDDELIHSISTNDKLVDVLGQNGIANYYAFLNDIKEISNFIQKYSNFYEVNFVNENKIIILNDFKDIKGISANELDEITRRVSGLPVANNIINEEDGLESNTFRFVINKDDLKKQREIEIKRFDPELALNTDDENERNKKKTNVVKSFDKKAYNEQLARYIKTLRHIDAIENDFRRIANIEDKDTKRTLDLMQMYVDAFKPLIQEDMDGFNAHKGEKCVDLNQMYSLARNKIIETQNFEKNRFGGNLSSRYKIDAEFNGFHQKTGFFTKNTHFYASDFDVNIGKLKVFDLTHFNEFYDPLFKYCDKADEEDDKDFLKEIKKTHPKFSDEECLDYLNQVKKQPDFETRKQGYTRGLVKLIEFIDPYTFDINDGSRIIKAKGKRINLENEKVKEILEILPENTAKYIRKNYNNIGFLGSLVNLNDIYGKTTISDRINKKYVRLTEGANISNRNCAMTAVEKILDLDVLADSHKLTIKQEDKEVKGVFMEEANGTNFVDMDPHDPRAYVKPKDINNASLLKSISDLQVLDYICGNVDRHAGNFFYKFDENHKLSGVIGIDNDASFSSEIPSENKGLLQLPSLKHLMVIDEKLANKLMTIDGNDLNVILKPYGLNNAEIYAATARLENLKRAIGRTEKDRIYYEKGFEVRGINGLGFAQLQIVKDKDWSNLTMDELSRDQNTYSSFENTYSKAFLRLSNVTKNKYVSSVSKADINRREFIINSSIQMIPYDMQQMYKKLTDLRSKLNNSNQYKNLREALEKLSNTPINYNGFKLSTDRQENINTKNNVIKKTIEDSFKEIKTLAKIYLDKKEMEAKNGSLDDVSKNKVQGVKDVLKYIDDKEKNILTNFDKLEADYIKSEKISQNFDEISQIKAKGGLTEEQIRNFEQSKNNEKQQITLDSLNENNNITQTNIQENDLVIDNLEKTTPKTIE